MNKLEIMILMQMSQENSYVFQPQML